VIDLSIDRALDARTNWLERYSKLRFTRCLRAWLSRDEAVDDERDVGAYCNG
jgi:hypothetical protein